MTVNLRRLITDIEECPALDWSNLTDAERDSVGVGSLEHDEQETYFRYLGNVYALSEFTVIDNANSHERLSGFDGGSATSAFTAVLIDISHYYTEDTIRVGSWSA